MDRSFLPKPSSIKRLATVLATVCVLTLATLSLAATTESRQDIIAAEKSFGHSAKNTASG